MLSRAKRYRNSSPLKGKIDSIMILTVEFNKKNNHQYKLTILAVNISFPRRAKRPRPSDDALRCDAQISPSARIFCCIKIATSLEKNNWHK